MYRELDQVLAYHCGPALALSLIHISNNDNPNYIIQVGNVFGFIISIENVL